MPPRPSWFNLRAIKKNPADYVQDLNKKESVDLAQYMDYRYHEKNKPVVDDEVYDLLIDHIKDKYPKAAYLKKVGHKVTTKGRKEVQLPVHMSSLSKIKPSSTGIESHIQGSLVVSEKLDGISLLLEYKNGVPYACYTRGNGVRGQDVSGVLSALDIPKRVSVKAEFYVRCEFIIKRKSFTDKHASSSGKGTYKTSRNMGGGLLTRNEPSSAVRDFDVVAYEIPKGKGAGKPISQQLAELKRMGFSVVRHKKYSGLTVDRLTKIHDNVRAKSPYDVDGIVVAQDKAYRVSSSNPKHAKAFKVNSLEATKIVKVKDIVWKRSRHGKWIPRVVVDPVQLGGVSVTSFTGHSYYYIQNGFRYQDRNKQLPVRPLNVGAEIRVVRSGDVIPYIMEVVKPARKPAQPDVAFTLDNTGVHALDIVEKGAKLDDTQKVQRIVHFFSAMQMKGIKSGIVEKLYASGFKTLRSILHAPPEKLMKAEGIQQKTAENIVKTVQLGLAKNATFANLGYASSIFGDKIGRTKLQATIDEIPDIVQLSTTLSPLQLRDRIAEVEGIKTQATIIAKRLPKFIRFLELNRIKIGSEVKQKKQSSRLEGMKVLFTSVRDDDLLTAIQANGGQKASSVKSATHLVIKPGASNKKTDEAEELGIPMLTVDEFRKKFKL